MTAKQEVNPILDYFRFAYQPLSKPKMTSVSLFPSKLGLASAYQQPLDLRTFLDKASPPSHGLCFVLGAGMGRIDCERQTLDFKLPNAKLRLKPLKANPFDDFVMLIHG